VLFFLLTSLALADDCDGVASLDAAVSEITAVVRSNAPRTKPGTLPAGTLSADQLEGYFQAMQRRGGTINDLFKALGDGQSRVLPGSVVRDLLKKYGVDSGSLPLPMDRLEQITSDGSSLDITFEGNAPIEITTPDSTVTYLRNGKLRRTTEDGAKIKVQPSIRFELGASGLTGVRQGDIKAYGGFLAGWVNIDIVTENRPGEVAKHKGRYPVVATGPDGRPVTQGGRPELARFDDWVVITGPFGYRSDIGIPALEAGR